MKIEDDRLLLKAFIKAVGLPVQKYEHVKGITALREYLKTHENVYIKTNIFRDDCESFFSKDYESVESELDQIADHLGAWKYTYDFVVEDAIETDVEIGFDGFMNQKGYAVPFLIGVEWRKNLYFGKVSYEMPPSIEQTMASFLPVLQRLKYAGALSTEEKIINQTDKHYLLDFCARLAHPFTTGYPEWIKNWPEFVYGIGKGEFVIPEFEHKYIGAFTLKSPKALEMYLKVDRKDKDKIKLVSAMSNDKGDFAVRGEDHIAVILAAGDSLEDILKQIHKNAELVDCNGLDKEALNGIDKITEVIEKCKAVGIKF
jgi:hypothetical protein